MNVRQFLQLVRFDLGYSWWVFAIGWIFTFPLQWTRDDVPIQHLSKIPFILLACGLGALLYLPWVMHNGEVVSGNWMFILTRSVRRKCFFRAKTTLLYLGVLIPAALLLWNAWLQPDITRRMSGREVTAEGLRIEEYQSVFPGSYLIERPKLGLRVPGAAPLEAAWDIILLLCAVIGTQLCCVICWKLPTARKKYRSLIIYLPQFLALLTWFASNEFRNPTFIRAFLFYAEHWLFITAVVLVAAIAVYRFAENQFELMEIP